MIDAVLAFCARHGLTATGSDDGQSAAIARPGGLPPVQVTWRAEQGLLTLLGPLALSVAEPRRSAVLDVLNAAHARSFMGAWVLTSQGRVYFRVAVALRGGGLTDEQLTHLLEVVISTVDAVAPAIREAA